jgi:hypothetical protein
MLDVNDVIVGQEYGLGNDRNGEYRGDIFIEDDKRCLFPSDKGKKFVESYKGELFHVFTKLGSERTCLNFYYVWESDSRIRDNGVVESKSGTYHTEILSRDIIFSIQQARRLGRQMGTLRD